VAHKFHFAILQIEVTRASHGLSAIAELLVYDTGIKDLMILFGITIPQSIAILMMTLVICIVFIRTCNCNGFLVRSNICNDFCTVCLIQTVVTWYLT